jgi:hypothetical protein
MDRFGPACKGSDGGRGDFGVDDAFSAHLPQPLTAKTVGWKLQSFL